LVSFHHLNVEYFKATIIIIVSISSIEKAGPDPPLKKRRVLIPSKKIGGS
jgi:hypothetical protein